MSSVLTETQRAVVETMTMRLHVIQALQYLKDCGYEMSRATYFRQKRKIENMKMERMQHIALHFQERHLERIDKSELIEKLMWENYYAEKNPTKKVSILTSIESQQLTLSSFYDTTRYVLEKGWKTPIYKVPEPYVSINIKNEVENEMDERHRQQRLAIEREREEQRIAEIDRNNPPAIDDEPLVHQDQVMPKPTIDQSMVMAMSDKQQPSVNSSPVKEQEEGEGEVIGRPWTPAEAYKAVRKAGSNTEYPD